MKKFIALSLMLAMSLSLFGCGSKPANVTPATPTPGTATPVASTAPAKAAVSFDKPVEIEYLGWSNNKLDGSDDIFKAIEKKFNMKLKYTVVPTGEYKNLVSMRVASGDIPEAFKTEVPSDAGMVMYRNLVADKVIINLSQYIDKYNFENLKKALSNPSAKLLSEPDGFYMVPNYLGPSLQAMFIRQDWMEKLNLSAPKTYDEYKTFLQKIVAADPDGKQTTGLTIPGVGGLEHIFSAFTGTSGNWVKYNGQWVHKITIPTFKDGVKYAASLYKDKLLDQEFALMNNNTVQEKVGGGKAAATILNGTVAWLTPIENALKANKPDGKIGTLVPWPAGPAGEVKNSGTPYYGAVHINKDATEDERVRILAFLDWNLTQDCDDLFFYGVEGKQHKIVDGKKVIDENAKKAVTFGRDLYPMYDIINNESQWKYVKVQPLLANRDWVTKHAVPDQVIGLANDVTINITPKFTDIYNKWITNFVTGAANIDTDWDKFVAEFKAAGYDQYQAEVVKYMKDK